MQSYKEDDSRTFQDLMRHSLIFEEEPMTLINCFYQILISIKKGESSEIWQQCNQYAELISEFRALLFEQNMRLEQFSADL